MATVLIVYGSTIGNTREVAEKAETLLRGTGASVTLLDAADAAVAGLCAGYDLILFGCSTWGDAEIELQPDFAALFDDFDQLGAQGKKTAVFGCGDSGYTWFCGAVDAIEEKLKQLGALLVVPGLKIDGEPAEAQAEIEAWLKRAAQAL